MVVCLERGANLHIAQLMPLPPTVSCFSKIKIGFTFLVPAHLGSPGQRAVKWVCVCACLLLWALAGTDGHRTISQTLLTHRKTETQQHRMLQSLKLQRPAWEQKLHPSPPTSNHLPSPSSFRSIPIRPRKKTNSIKTIPAR